MCAYCITSVSAGCECISAFCLPTVALRALQHNNEHTSVQSHDHPFPSLITQQRSIYWGVNAASIRKRYKPNPCCVREWGRPPRQNGRVELTTPSNPTKQCRGINPDYLPLLFLEINEKSLGQIRVQGMLKKKLMQKSHDCCFFFFYFHMRGIQFLFYFGW